MKVAIVLLLLVFSACSKTNESTSQESNATGGAPTESRDRDTSPTVLSPSLNSGAAQAPVVESFERRRASPLPSGVPSGASLR